MFPFFLIPFITKARRDFETSTEKKPKPIIKTKTEAISLRLSAINNSIGVVCDYENVLSLSGIGTIEDFNRTYKVKQILASKVEG